MLAVPAGRMGDQLILEEDHDENYIPQEHEIQEYARMIGINPDTEPELMWLAREGIVAPLPPDWKPCQDVTGDIYYFNFATGQSTWDHPIDEHYRELVVLEREKQQGQGGGKKKEKEKKKKKEKKKEKKPKDIPKPVLSLGSPLGPVGGLAPLRALGDSTGSSGGMRGSQGSSAGSSGGFDNLLGGTSGKTTSYLKTTTGRHSEERVSLTLPGLAEEDENGDKESEDQSPRGSARLLKNLHMDIGSLGGGFEYEESEQKEESAAVSCTEEGTEPELQNLGKSEDEEESQKKRRLMRSGNVHPSSISAALSSQASQDSNVGIDETFQAEECEPVHCASPAEMSAQKEEPLPGSFDKESKEGKASENSAPSIAGELGSGARECILEQDERDESEPSEAIKDVPKFNSKLGTKDFLFGIQSLEKVHDITSLSPGPASPKEAIEEELDEDVEEEISDDDYMMPVKEPLDDTKRQIHLDTKQARATVEPMSAKEPKLSAQLLRNDSDSSQISEKESGIKSEISKHNKQPPKLIDELPKTSDNSRKIVEQGKSALEEEHRQKLEDLKNMFSKEEEEKKHSLQELHNSNIRSLEAKLQRESEEEEAKMREAQKQKLLKLEKELIKEREDEEEKIQKRELEIREEHQQRLLKLKEELLQEKNDLFEKLKLETENLLQQERTTILHEREIALKELGARLEQETKMALELLENKHVMELEQLKATVTEKHQKEISDLQDTKHVVQLGEVSQSPSNLYLINKKISHVLDFEKEMSDLLQEKRNEVQREHERKLERMKEEHRQEMENIWKQFEEEEQTQRSQMLEKLQDEIGKLRRRHEKELEAQQKEQEKCQEERQHSYREKEKMIEDLEQNQEIRRKQLMIKRSQLDKEEETLQKRKEELEEKERELERKIENVTVQENAVKEQRYLNDLMKQTRKELETMQDRKSDLESQVQQLQSLYTRLQESASDLEGEIKSRHEKLKQLSKEELMDKMDSELHLEDLTKMNSSNHASNIPYQADIPKPSLSSTPISATPSAMDDLRYYISSQGASLHKAKDFLRLQTHSMCRRQSLLKAAKQQWRHNMHESQDPEQAHQLEGIRKNLEEEAHNLKDIHDTMEKGQTLLQQKEQCLQELENSLLEEMSEEEAPKARRSKKFVTFDVSDSDDTSSVMSMDGHKCDLIGSLDCLPMKVKHLTQSLHHITAELNSVLSSLDPLRSEHSSVLHSENKLSSAPGIPLSAYISMSKMDRQMGLRSSSPWAWKVPVPSSVQASSSATQSVNALMMEKWHKYFPGSSPLLSDQSLHSENKLGYVSAGEQLREMQSASFHSKYTDKHNIQAMIDSNKKWLQNFKHDPKVPLGPSRSTSGAGLVQLGLDENNQIRVYQF
ncbi:centrosomal protein of 164 kDa isoform X1 [Pyxicephalus adspersus]|uniref:centrosomal protein of 164 kDa isoform X1 n=1 Tax=Pyxicephalus adspersus TaxID=30357 RepID=UPI003B5CD700